jgi:hypothetical protein
MLLANYVFTLTVASSINRWPRHVYTYNETDSKFLSTLIIRLAEIASSVRVLAEFSGGKGFCTGIHMLMTVVDMTCDSLVIQNRLPYLLNFYLLQQHLRFVDPCCIWKVWHNNEYKITFKLTL